MKRRLVDGKEDIWLNGARQVETEAPMGVLAVVLDRRRGTNLLWFTKRQAASELIKTNLELTLEQYRPIVLSIFHFPSLPSARWPLSLQGPVKHMHMLDDKKHHTYICIWVGRFGCRLNIGVGIDGILFGVAGFGSLCFGGLRKSYQSSASQEGSCGKWSCVTKPCLSQSIRIRKVEPDSVIPTELESVIPTEPKPYKNFK
ncbi:unnamed protein product [Lactuca saligna]|uniref:Uncharacterized protein n=1 Tax=Lactuca saligna TaxID=75948 RepID=A0AA36EBI6_LACSI|nr:unnamed protein product [Lactuca saligna]